MKKLWLIIIAIAVILTLGMAIPVLAQGEELEVLYEKDTMVVRAWNADKEVQGLFHKTTIISMQLIEGEHVLVESPCAPYVEDSSLAVVILPIKPPTFKSDVYYVDLDNETIVGNPEYKPIQSRQLHWGRITAFDVGNARPVTVSRTINEHTYSTECFVTVEVKDEYQAGGIKIGDYVLVAFLDNDVNRAIVIAKIYKTW